MREERLIKEEARLMEERRRTSIDMLDGALSQNMGSLSIGQDKGSSSSGSPRRQPLDHMPSPSVRGGRGSEQQELAQLRSSLNSCSSSLTSNTNVGSSSLAGGGESSTRSGSIGGTVKKSLRRKLVKTSSMEVGEKCVICGTLGR